MELMARVLLFQVHVMKDVEEVESRYPKRVGQKYAEVFN